MKKEEKRWWNKEHEKNGNRCCQEWKFKFHLKKQSKQLKKKKVKNHSVFYRCGITPEAKLEILNLLVIFFRIKMERRSRPLKL